MAFVLLVLILIIGGVFIAAFIPDNVWDALADRIRNPPPKEKGYYDWLIAMEQGKQLGMVGEPCPKCGEELLWDSQENMVFCENDYKHG